MYKIVFKGKDIEPLFLDDEKGKVVWQAWLDNKSVRIVADNHAFSTSDIRNIAKLAQSNAEMAVKPTNQENEYLEFRRKMLGLTLEQRAAILRFPKMIWSSVTEEEMPNEIKEEIKKRQLAYFTENPKCIYTNPKIYRDLIPLPRERNTKKDDMKSIQSILPVSMMRFIENAVQTDLVYAK